MFTLTQEWLARNGEQKIHMISPRFALGHQPSCPGRSEESSLVEVTLSCYDQENLNEGATIDRSDEGAVKLTWEMIGEAPGVF